MGQSLTPNRTCPACGSGDDTSRSRKKVTPQPGLEGEGAVEAQYRCQACEHEEDQDADEIGDAGDVAYARRRPRPPGGGPPRRVYPGRLLRPGPGGGR